MATSHNKNTINAIAGALRTDSQGNTQYYDGANWIAVLQGPPGPPGPQGYPGPCGMMGAKGDPGVGSDGSISHDIKLQSTNGQRISVGELVDFVKIMKERMLIITPNFEKHEKYPALKELYEQYLVMDRLINDDHNPGW